MNVRHIVPQTGMQYMRVVHGFVSSFYARREVRLETENSATDIIIPKARATSNFARKSKRKKDILRKSKKLISTYSTRKKEEYFLWS